MLASIPQDGDAPRLIRDAGAGMVVPAGDSQSLADAVLWLKRDPQGAREMGARGRRHAEHYLARTVCADQNEAIFRQLLGTST